MLSTKESPVLLATIKGGKYNGEHIYYHDTIDDKNIMCVDLFDILQEDDVRSLKKKMSVKDIKELKKALINKIDPVNPELHEMYNILKDKVRTESIKKIKIYDDGVIIPTPFINDLNSDERSIHQYIAGATGSGKTYYVARYLELITKLYKKKKIFIFSDVEEDKLLDKFKVTRIALNEEIVDNPILPSELANSIVLFDDIDSIPNKNIKKAVETLRDSLLKRGRHENIHVITTNHLLTDYKNTRVLLSECCMVVFFPRSGSTHSINYLLTKYIGLSKKQIAEIFKMPSRSVCIYKNYPQTVISDKEIYIL